MAPRRRSGPAVEIVLSEEDLEAIIRETTGEPGAPRSAEPPVPGAWAAPPATAPFRPVADRVWTLGVRHPGAVGDAIRRILEATTLDRRQGHGEEE